jgi:hypothetical protein
MQTGRGPLPKRLFDRDYIKKITLEAAAQAEKLVWTSFSPSRRILLVLHS